MKKSLYLLAFALASVFSLNSFAQRASTAQLVETSVGRFYQKDALSWDLNGNTLHLLERGKYGAITLQDIKTLDQYRLDFSQGRVFLLKEKTYVGVDIGQITKAIEASGPGLNGVSVLLGMRDRTIQVDADRYFAPQGKTIETALTSDGTPGQWGRFVYTRMGTSVVPTTGKNVNRVDLSNGDRFQKVDYPVGHWAELDSHQYSWTNEWLRIPKSVYFEKSRDDWSVYLEKMFDSSTSVQIDLYTKKVTWSKGKTVETKGKTVENILPEKFPSYGQFSRTEDNTIDDNVFKKDVTATSLGIKATNAADVYIDLLQNSCAVRGGRCEVLQGEFKPRGITGFALGGFTLSGKMFDKHNGTVAFDQGSKGYMWTYSFNPEKFTNPEAAMFKARDRVIFASNKADITLSLDDSSMTPLLPFNQQQVVTSTQQYFAGQMQGFLPEAKPALGPGFLIRNTTDWPVLVSIDQVGCLYHKIIQPRKSWEISTGSVWFTVKASISPTLVEPTDWDCAKAPVIMVAAVTAAAVISGVTAGTGAGAGAAVISAAMLESAVATAVTVGAASGLQVGLEASGMSDRDAAFVAAGITIFGSVAKGGVTLISKTLPAAATKAAAAGTSVATAGSIAVAKVVVVQSLKATGRIVSANDLQPATQAQLDTYNKQLSQEDRKYGVYAGKTWPFKEVERKKAVFDVVGGPTVKRFPDTGNGLITEFMLETTPFALKQTQ